MSQKLSVLLPTAQGMFWGDFWLMAGVSAQLTADVSALL